MILSMNAEKMHLEAFKRSPQSDNHRLYEIDYVAGPKLNSPSLGYSKTLEAVSKVVVINHASSAMSALPKVVYRTPQMTDPRGSEIPMTMSACCNQTITMTTKRK